MEDLSSSINQYKTQLLVVKQSLQSSSDAEERQSLLELQSELQQLIDLTQESIDAQSQQISTEASEENDSDKKNDLDDEYALFMSEMAQSGAYENENSNKALDQSDSKDDDSDIEDELSSLLGMKCAVYHTHSWGSQSLHNAMVSSVVPRQDDDQFGDLQVRILFTHPTHNEMLPCPYFLNGECKFDDEKCRYSHGAVVQLSSLKEAIEPHYDTLKVGSRVLLKLKPPDTEDITTPKKSTEIYHLWHRGVVTSIDLENRLCTVKLEQRVNTGEKRKSSNEEHHVHFEEIFPLNNDNDSSDSDDSISDTEYPERKVSRVDFGESNSALIVEKSLQNNSPALGEWEKHTRGIASKLMLAMGYVAGSGLGATGEGRVQPVEARLLPAGKTLDHCMAISEKARAQDPLKVEQRLKRLQKREEERNKRAYEREKERERRNVFNFINKTLGDTETNVVATTSIDLKQTSSKDLNVEKFKLEEESRRVEVEIVKLKNTISKYPPGTTGHRSMAQQLTEKNKELAVLRNKEQQVAREQKHRKDKQKMTVF